MLALPDRARLLHLVDGAVVRTVHEPIDEIHRDVEQQALFW
jgi:hypothetical protein